MSGASKQRNRQERIDSLGIQKPRLVQWWQDSDKADFATRIVMAVVAAVVLLVLLPDLEAALRLSQGRDSDPGPDHASHVRGSR